MPNMRLPNLVDGYAAVPAALRDVSVRDLTLNSRHVTQGAGFIAIKGDEADGKHFISAAFAGGAVAALADADPELNDPRIITIPNLRAKIGAIAKRFYGDPSRQLRVIAVTGTNGKTSITDYVGQLLRLLGESAGTIGTLGARTQAVAVAATQNTTPDIVSLNRQLAEWSATGFGYAALEASSHALVQDRLNGLTLHTGIFSNLTRDHLDYHHDIASYKRAKLRLFRDFRPEKIIFNADDTATCEAKAHTSGLALGISLTDPSADVYVQVLDENAAGISCYVHTPYGSGEVQTRLHGGFNAFNLAAAIVTICGLGFPFNGVVNAAQQVAPVEGRMHRLGVGADIRVVVDYAHTPDALNTVLRALRASCGGELWVVFGCGGDRDAGKRADMGRIAAELACHCILTNDNPRGEDPASIAADIREGSGGFDWVTELDRDQAIGYAINTARSGDTVLIAGKGHERHQTIGPVRTLFSDIDVAERHLAARGVAHV